MILGTLPWNGDGNGGAGSQAGNGWNSGGRSGDLERMELVSFWVTLWSGFFCFFERQLLSLLLSFFSAAPVASRSRCNLESVSKILRK